MKKNFFLPILLSMVIFSNSRYTQIEGATEQESTIKQLYDQGQQLNKQGDLQGAANKFENAIERAKKTYGYPTEEGQPSIMEMYVSLGLTLKGQDYMNDEAYAEFDKALDEYEKLCKADPKSTIAYVDLITIFAGKSSKLSERALGIFEEYADEEMYGYNEALNKLSSLIPPTEENEKVSL